MTPPVAPSGGAPDHLDLVLALRGFRIRSDPALRGDPRRFCRTLAIVCGDTELPPLDDAAAAARSEGLALPAPPSDPRELGLAAAELAREGWPEAAVFAVRGVFAFGPCNFAFAERCALYSLHLEPGCLLARQLLAMLLARQEYQRTAPRSSPGELLALFQKAARAAGGA